MSTTAPAPSVHFVLNDDLRRSRPAVFFRLILVIPHLIWLSIWSIGAGVVAVLAWIAVVVTGRLPTPFHDFFVMYLRFVLHLAAYLFVVADKYPSLIGKPGYAVDITVDSPAPQRRLTAFVRLVLMFPAILLAYVIPSAGIAWVALIPAYAGFAIFSTITAPVIFAWIASLVLGRTPRGLRDLNAYGLGYGAQVLGYAFFLTERYPSSDPRFAGPMALPEHAVQLELKADLLRPRLLVFFRYLLVLPHLVWLALWSVAALVTAFAGWLTALFLGRLPRPFHRFLAAYVRYATHVAAFLYLVGGPFPGFVGAQGSYPVDVQIDPPARQGRWGILFRGLIAFPALSVASVYGVVAFVVGMLGWWSSIFRGRMPEGMTNLGAVSLRYLAQTWAYALLLTDRYPYAAPALEDAPEPEDMASEPTQIAILPPSAEAV